MPDITGSDRLTDDWPRIFRLLLDRIHHFKLYRSTSSVDPIKEEFFNILLEGMGTRQEITEKPHTYQHGDCREYAAGFYR
jgi:hypothetical protein